MVILPIYCLLFASTLHRSIYGFLSIYVSTYISVYLLILPILNTPVREVPSFLFYGQKRESERERLREEKQHAQVI